MAMSSSADSAARPLPRLARVWDGQVEPLNPARLAGETDVTFLAVPEQAAAELAPPLVDAGVRVIDLSGAFRIRDAGARGRCYPTAALLSLLPLSRAGLLDAGAGVIVDAKSGISGAGRAPSDRTHFSENHGSVSAYGIFGHRHVAEMEQELGAVVTFVPHLVPLDRGILETMYVKVAPGTTVEQIAEAFEGAYRAEPFVRLTGDALPEIKHVAWTNFCDIGWKLDAPTGRLVLVACLDNLVKGA